jgi:hypothetical protein
MKIIDNFAERYCTSTPSQVLFYSFEKNVFNYLLTPLCVCKALSANPQFSQGGLRHSVLL